MQELKPMVLQPQTIGLTFAGAEGHLIAELHAIYALADT